MNGTRIDPRRSGAYGKVAVDRRRHLVHRRPAKTDLAWINLRVTVTTAQMARLTRKPTYVEVLSRTWFRGWMSGSTSFVRHDHVLPNCPLRLFDRRDNVGFTLVAVGLSPGD